MQEFARYSGIFGLEFVTNKHNGWFVRLFWLLFILIVSALTLKDLVTTAVSFYNEDTVAALECSYTENIVLDPPPTFCFWLDTEYLLLETNLTAVSLLLDDLKPDGPIDTRLVNLFYAMLADLGRRENALLWPTSPGKDYFSNWSFSFMSSSHFFAPFPSAVQESLSVVYVRTVGKLDRNFISRLVGELARIIDLQAHMDIDDVPLGQTKRPCSETSVTVVESGQFCCRLSEEPISYVLPLQMLSVIYKLDKMALNRSNGYVGAKAKIQLDGITGREYVALMENSVPANGQMFAANIQGLYRSYNKRSRPCSEEKTAYDCLQRCWANRVFNACGCWPSLSAFAYNAMSGEQPRMCMEQGVSGLPLISECWQKLVTQNDSSMFSADENSNCPCLHDCKAVVYGYALVPMVASPSWNDNHEIYSVITFPNHVYPVFEERLANDWTSLLSNVGGTLGLWLGLCFAALINIPFSLALAAARKLLRLFNLPITHLTIEMEPK